MENGGFDGGGGGGGGGNEAVGHMLLYHDNVSSSRFCAGNFSTNSQPFDIFASSHSSFSSKSPEGTMATTMAFPFTYAQWKELERQAMIYKYMIYSVPVPSDLLLPLLKTPPVDSSVSSIRYSKNGDPEPGRCKRTDGKKWRCSKNVAPNQKYCERHLHRGRPRSRKPVEDKNVNGETNKRNLKNDDKPLLNQDLSLMMMESEMKRQRLIETNLGYSIYDSSSLFHHDYVNQNQLNFAASEMDDYWSIENGNVESFGPREPPSLNLSISMASGPEYCGPFSRGGPLAEAFKNPASPVATPVESPTGVLHRTLFSHSDGSVCNSPTFPAPMSEVAFRWLS